MKTINDLPSNISLGGVKFKHPKTGEICIWHSQWQKGIWYRKEEKENQKNTQIFPLYLEDLMDSLKFEVVD